MAHATLRAAARAALCSLVALSLFSAVSFTAHLRAPEHTTHHHGTCLPKLSALEASAGLAARWDPRDFPAFLVNGKTSRHKRKWAESQLFSIGYTEYTRVNGGNSSGVKENCLRCRVGVMLGHHRAWSKFLLTGAPHGFFFEDDVVFHSNFVTAWHAYVALIPANFSFLYVGQLSRRYRSEPAPTLVQSEVCRGAPTHTLRNEARWNSWLPLLATSWREQSSPLPRSRFGLGRNLTLFPQCSSRTLT